jgi:hypothetical protein
MAEYEYRVEIDWVCGNELTERLNAAAAKGYRLAQCIFAGYREENGINHPHYTLIFERVREKAKARGR